MKLKLLANVKGRFDVQSNSVVLATKTFYPSRQPQNPNIAAYRCGRGSVVKGFSPNGWVFKVDQQWYLRVPGNGERGQYHFLEGKWATYVEKATKAQAMVLEHAETS